MKHIPKILFSALLLLSVLYCTKQGEDNNPNAVTQKLTERDGRETSTQPVLNTDENGNYAPFLNAPLFEAYDGQCKIILRLHGSSPVVSSAQIQIKGYQSPSLSSTLLFTIPSATIFSNQWTTINIPQGAHITVKMVSGSPGDGIQLSSQEYGFNMATGVVGGPIAGIFAQNAEEFILIPKFAPYSNDSRYTCESWCCWRINYTCEGDIIPNQPRLMFRSTWSTGSSVLTQTMKTYYLQQPTSGASVLVFPLSDASSIYYNFVADSYPSNNPLPNFCYSITPILSSGPLNINDIISNITFGTTPPIRCTNDCHLAPRSSNFPHCQ